LSIKTRLEKLEAKVKPKPKPIRPMLRIIERHIDLEGLDDDGIPVMIMSRPGERPDTFAISKDFLPGERPKDTDQDTLTITYVETPGNLAREQASKKFTDVGELSESEPDDADVETEIKKLEKRKAELMAKE